ncbi:autotransporter outer membrane beta-barrel domain-containing protein, partial [Pelagibacterales bacterium]|nr:autotransporter outer membrane beta-barrel domain-containing protein [Pelagibacterales bacterium]
YDEKTYIDGTLGISLLDMNLTRSHASGTLTGSREGKQLFGSLVYSAALEENQIKITPYGRIDGGYTILSSFSDTGTVAAIKYDEQKITSAMISLGILVDDEIEINNLKLNRYGRLEYGKDISSSSDAMVSYVAVPNTKYILSIDDEESNNIRAAFGTDIETQYKWSYQFDYEVNHRSGSSHLNTFSVAAFYELGMDSMISLSLDSEPSTHSIAKLELDTRLRNGWFFNGAYEMKDYKDLSNENMLRLQAVRYF